MDEPEDLGIKTGTPEEAAWTLIRDKCKEEIASCLRTMAMDEVLILLAEEKIAEEQSK